MQKIFPRTRVIMRRVHRILKIGRRRKWLLRMAVKPQAPKIATMILKTTVKNQKVVAMKRPPPLTLKVPVNIVGNSNVYGTLIMVCPKCFWHDYNKICPICNHHISEERNYTTEDFLRCHDCGAITNKNATTLETNLYSPSKQENEKEELLISIPFKSICI